MSLTRLFSLITIACSLFVVRAHAQNQPIGSWRSFLPYSTAIGLATDGNTLMTIGNQAFYTFNGLTGQMDAYSKVEGMSDIGMQCVGYDMATSTTVLVYANGNIDLFKDNTFYNIPELKIKTVAGSKTVYEVFTLNGYAYLSTSLGVIVLDLAKRNVKETYEFNINNQVVPVNSITSLGDSLYAVTPKGVYCANRNSNELQNFQVWRSVDTSLGYNTITALNGSLFVASLKSVYKLNNGVPALLYTTPYAIEHIDASASNLYISEYDTAEFSGSIKIYNVTGGIYDSIPTPAIQPVQVVQTLDGVVWIANANGGLMKYNDKKELGFFTPTGPLNPNSFDIYAHNREFWVAHGGFTDMNLPSGNFSGLCNYKDDKWRYLTRYVYPPFNELSDFCVFEKDEVSGVIYAGSFSRGLFILNPDGAYEHLNENSIFDPSISIGLSRRQVAGLGLDSKRNLWVSTMYSVSQLYVRTLENEWYKFKVPGAIYGGPIVVDDEDQVWFSGQGGGGLNVYNANGTVADKSDDFSYHLSTGKGYGNLPSNVVNCLAKDNNNNIWVGTANGIGIINNCSAPFNQTPPCDAEIPIVQYDEYAGYLFAGNNVRTIAVDGANRKWVGTYEGVWLLSPDAGKIIYRFTTDNSPLPSNRIQKITVDQVTGDVYIGTDQGLMSYRSTATEGGTTNKEVLSFPNPVPSGYTGTIAIKGLVANADVRITDISGQLVYRTKALGGQAVWDGLDYTGRKPQSGVYLIFASDNTGEETYTGKLVFLK